MLKVRATEVVTRVGGGGGGVVTRVGGGGGGYEGWGGG